VCVPFAHIQLVPPSIMASKRDSRYETSRHTMASPRAPLTATGAATFLLTSRRMEPISRPSFKPRDKRIDGTTISFGGMPEP
jgi:hypothetical protein